MNDLNRLKVLSGILTEGFDPDRTDTSQEEIVAAFRDLLGILEKEYSNDENMKGIIYHYGGKLDELLRQPEDDEYGDEEDY